ncbi:3-hydroxyacyl-CoA dehydrogenase [uncultured Roseovarius sp.]|uniref:3-hydroxyacyl-CoA dehydrogenase n=1 Tax=uncultured Roseovarius sp. TaxID=293344 RepID=UPI00262C1AE7|nr:3-hydroxyacyl-CoA dehydrogenase [uncultured Roseovarius sp.]
MARVVIIGCGLIGRAWTISFLRGGHDVVIWDPEPAAMKNLRDSLAATFDDLRDHDLLSEPTELLLSRLTLGETLEQAITDARHVQENTPEVLDSKRAIFARLEAAAGPDTVLASSTSGLLPSAIFEGLETADRCLIAHPINPPFLVPAVEIVPGPGTRSDVVQRTADLLSSLGQAPIVMKKEVDGFLMNRLQGALLNEAFRLVAEGYASAEDVDIGIRDGLALRWAFMGPFETIDLNAPGGVRDYVDRYAGMYRQITEGAAPVPDWTSVVLDEVETDRRACLKIEDLPERQAWRDRRLMALVEHKNKVNRGDGA